MEDHDIRVLDDEVDSLTDFLIPNISGKVFFDVGAYRGIWSIIAAFSGAREIHLFEPNRYHLALAVKNMSETGARFYSYDKVIWSFRGEIKYNNWRANSNGSLRECDKLDNYMKFAPDFIKIDVEGSDIEVLKGARQLLEEYHPMIMIEDHGRTQEIVEILESLEYKSAPTRESRHLFFKKRK